MLTITSAASDRSLLTLAELRTATGSTDDAALTVLGARVSTIITRACNVATAGTTPPTLRQETLTDVFRMDCSPSHLILSRRPVVSITSVVEDAVTVLAADYEADSGTGLLFRLCDDYRTLWSASKITVVYVAGWDSVPDDMKMAATKLSRILWFEDGPNARDPGLKREKVEGVGEFEYWLGAAGDPLLSTEILELIAPYRNVWM